MTAQERRMLDAWIAEHVEGWKWYTLNPKHYGVMTGERLLLANNDHHLVYSDAYVPCDESLPLADDWDITIPRYTESWNLIMPLLPQGLWVYRGVLRDTWSVYQNVGTGNDPQLASAERGPLAVCLALKVYHEANVLQDVTSGEG